MRVQIVSPSEHQHLVSLPLATPLDDWRIDGLDEVLGIHRHVVRRLATASAVYVVKELPDDLALREFTLLRELAEESLPVVDVVAVVTERRAPDGALDGLLITRHLEYSLPYRSLLARRVAAGEVPAPERSIELHEPLRDALVGLLVRLHLAGFYWGDCSLSNTLFRRDAGALSAYVVDVETGERHLALSDGQRALDMQIATENIAGGLFDLQAAGRLSPSIDPAEAAAEIERRYESLWTELTGVEEFAPDESFRIEQRLDRLHALGYDVGEMEIVTSADGRRLRLVPQVVEHGYHAARLRDLTGLDTEENQARRLLNDIRDLREQRRAEQSGSANERAPATLPDDREIADRWMNERFGPVIGALPEGLAAKLEPAEIYHQYLEHRWYLSERIGADADPALALRSFIDEVLTAAPDEQVMVPAPTVEMPVIKRSNGDGTTVDR